jgi:hypothetical protein
MGFVVAVVSRHSECDMSKKPNRVVYRDSKTGKLVSKQKWKNSKAQGGTRYKRQVIKKQKEFKWSVRYHVSGARKKRNKFFGEMVFTTSKEINQKEANKISAQLIRGERVKDVQFKVFNYDHRTSDYTRHVDDFDDLPDFEFLVEDDNDSYLSD